MAEAYLNEGATSLAAANWSDTDGFVDDAELAIIRGQTVITGGLNTTAGTTDGIDYLHVRRGFSGTIGGAGGSLLLEFDSTYTTKPNFVYAASGGAMWISCEGFTCNKAVIDTAGTLNITGGTWTSLEVKSGNVFISDAAVVTNLIVPGGSVSVGPNATPITLVRVTENGSVYTERTGTTIEAIGGTATLRPLSGAITTLEISEGARVNLIRGNVTTLNGYGGVIDHRSAEISSTISTTNAYPQFLRLTANVGGASPVYTAINSIAGGEDMASIGSGIGGGF